MMQLVQQTQSLNERLTRLEQLWEATRHDSVAQADGEDLLELRVQSARLAAELTRVTVELRSEIDDLARAAGLVPVEQRGGDTEPEADDVDRVEAVAAEGVIDLSTRRDRAHRPPGWRPIDPAGRP